MLGQDRLLSLGEAAKYMRKVTGLPVSPVSLWRWARFGVEGVKMETRAFGRRLFTTSAALDSFGKACSAMPLRKRKKRSVDADPAADLDIDAALAELTEPRVVAQPGRGRRRANAKA